MEATMFKYAFILFAGLWFTACSSTTVILLPDSDGSTGKAVVKTLGKSRTIDAAYASTTVEHVFSGPSKARTLEEKMLSARYQKALAAHPLKPVSFILYFKTDSIILTKNSQSLIPEIVKTAKAREPYEISVIGHTDTAGSRAYNVQLSTERAKAAEQFLRAEGIRPEKVSLKSFGENDPLVPTADNVHKLRNRRVEIMIR